MDCEQPALAEQPAPVFDAGECRKTCDVCPADSGPGLPCAKERAFQGNVVTVPPGHVVVPLEPTEDQVDAPRQILLYYDTKGRTYEGLRQFLDCAGVDYKEWCPEWFKTENGHMTKAGTATLVYAAALAARPGGKRE